MTCSCCLSDLPLSNGNQDFSGAGQPHLGSYMPPSESHWFLCPRPPLCWEHRGGFMDAPPCRTGSLALTFADPRSQPPAEVLIRLWQKVPSPMSAGSCETSPVWEENGKRGRRAHNWTPIAWNMLAKTATFKQLLSSIFAAGDLSRQIPSNRKYCSTARCSSSLCFKSQSQVLRKICQMAWLGINHFPFSVTLGALKSFAGVYIIPWTTNSISTRPAFI